MLIANSHDLNLCHTAEDDSKKQNKTKYIKYTKVECTVLIKVIIIFSRYAIWKSTAELDLETTHMVVMFSAAANKVEEFRLFWLARIEQLSMS